MTSTLNFARTDRDTLAALFDHLSSQQTPAVLTAFSEGDIVAVEGRDGAGVIVAVMTETFEYPTSDGDQRVEATDDEPAYVVAMESGGNVVVDGGKLSEGSFDADTGDADPSKLASQAEEAAIYSRVENPCTTELLNVPGVDDPGVGFDSLPDGWNRATVLDAWASMGGTWRSCRAEMTGEVTSPQRFCSAFKDEVLQTEQWRNSF